MRAGLNFWNGAAVAALVALAPSAYAVAAPRLIAYDIKAGPLDQALASYMIQSHRQVLYATETVAGRTAPSVHGPLTPEEALSRLLARTGIEANVTTEGVVTLKPRSRVIAVPAGEAVETHTVSNDLPAAPDGLQTASTALPNTPSSPASVSEVVVTGTNIRGVRSSPSPITTLTRDMIDRSGYATVAEALNALPQAFNGAATPATFLIGSDRLGTNDTAATGINLRGLGATSTLVLIDGRRMAGTGLQGDFADVSAIPTAIVDRVDVLLDGASALYGSDAVGGVVNVILRKDFEGWETRGRLGAASGGSAFERQIAQTFGHAWSGGHVLATYEYDARDALAGRDRPFTASADLRALGGTDHRLFYSHPGNILVSDPDTGAVAPGYAIPLGQNGTALTAASFLPGQVNLDNQRADADTLPNQRRESVYLALSQDLGSSVEFSADLRFTRRTFAFDVQQPLALLNVTSNNPFYVSPTGAPSELIGYSFEDELGPLRLVGSSQSFGGSAGVDVDLGHGWRANIYGASATETGRRLGLHRLDTRFVKEALGAIPDSPATAFSATRDGYFNPFGDGGANSPAVLDFIGSGYTQEVEHSEVHSLNAKMDGPLFNLPGGEVKLAVGAQVRWESFRDGGSSLSSGAVPSAYSDGPYDRTVGAAFGEALIPVIGATNALPGLRSLILSLAGRLEDYSDVGVTANPKIGLVWEPAHDLVVKASYGTSFRAPTLTDIFSAGDVGPAFLPLNGVNTLILALEGGNRDLKPEHAVSWTTTIDYRPSWLPHLSLEGSFFDTNFTQRIGQPVNDDIFNALGNPVYAPFIQTLDPNSASDLAKVNALLASSTSGNAGLFPASAYGAIVDIRYVNTGGLHVQGLDLTGSYDISLGDSRFNFAMNGSYLLTYDVRVTPTSSPLHELNLPNQPVDFRGQATGGWTRGPWNASATLRYVDSYRDTLGRAIDAWTTTDLQVRWTSPVKRGVASGVVVSVTVQNLLDQDPPFYDASIGVGYDAANADPLGRVTSLQIQKRW